MKSIFRLLGLAAALTLSTGLTNAAIKPPVLASMLPDVYYAGRDMGQAVRTELYDDYIHNRITKDDYNQQITDSRAEAEFYLAEAQQENMYDDIWYWKGFLAGSGIGYPLP
ncbi:hypothetical protein [Hymenobacter persicinus]|uniref:GLPGLI family protein n=1 Tax=Hymenobacter persicinus TaxID=2025506 RepID=A0A4Q5L9D6_9BACT|nr:hypothetical protein [Hymenobacter persicinus]RYU76449.1 hypothetical protein EWM57_18525 [Hymenobacter persicinus]